MVSSVPFSISLGQLRLEEPHSALIIEALGQDRITSELEKDPRRASADGLGWWKARCRFTLKGSALAELPVLLLLLGVQGRTPLQFLQHRNEEVETL
jgi:hypothetical protein